MSLRSWRFAAGFTAVAVGVLAIGAMSSPARAETSVGIHVDIGAPVVIYREQPRTVYVPEEGVYVVDDPDEDSDGFHYGAYWYVWRGDSWYRARTWRGPFRVIETRYVPAAIYDVPERHWKHHPHGGPPGLMRKRAWADDRREWRERERERDERRGHGHGHGRGHDDD